MSGAIKDLKSYAATIAKQTAAFTDERKRSDSYRKMLSDMTQVLSELSARLIPDKTPVEAPYHAISAFPDDGVFSERQRVEVTSSIEALGQSILAMREEQVKMQLEMTREVDSAVLDWEKMYGSGNHAPLVDSFREETKAQPASRTNQEARPAPRGPDVPLGSTENSGKQLPNPSNPRDEQGKSSGKSEASKTTTMGNIFRSKGEKAATPPKPVDQPIPAISSGPSA